jgi:hypothetical protein
MRADSDNLEHWGGNLTIFAAGPGDPENLEFYTMSVADMRFAYSYHGLHLGFLHYFHTDLNGKRNPANNVAMSGPIDIYLVTSRDTVNWQRVNPEKPFLPHGAAEAFDSGMVFMCSMIEHKDRLLFYYDGWNVEHGQLVGTPTIEGHAYIGLATLRLDGFVSLEPEGRHGTVTTKPLAAAGQKLLVNADARRGRLLVEVLDQADRAQPGFSSADCRPVTTDSLRAHVTWKKRSLSELRGQTIRLRFHLYRGAALYAFQFAPAGG